MLEELPPEITRIRLEDIILRIKVGCTTHFLYAHSRTCSFSICISLFASPENSFLSIFLSKGVGVGFGDEFLVEMYGSSSTCRYSAHAEEGK